MYIPEFWCGVAVTLLLETVILIGAIIHFGRKSEEMKKGQNSNGKKNP